LNAKIERIPGETHYCCEYRPFKGYLAEGCPKVPKWLGYGSGRDDKGQMAVLARFKTMGWRFNCDGPLSKHLTEGGAEFEDARANGFHRNGKGQNGGIVEKQYDAIEFAITRATGEG